ncbi:MAG: hypothetical protein KDA42_16280, partial [Planctomycetales bacterium]|nr:hypothetical protein [Planctomycetales bacterium]
LAELEETLKGRWLEGRSPLGEFVFGKRDFGNHLEEYMRVAARDVVAKEIQQSDTAGMLLSLDNCDAPGDPLQVCLDAAMPRLLSCGGAARLLLVIPEGSREAIQEFNLEQRCGQAATIALDQENDIAVCFEATGVPLVEAARVIINDRPEQAKLASRVHTRIDVQWSDF